MATMKLPTHLASGNTSLAQLDFLLLLMILESSMLVKNMPNTFSMHSKNIIPLTLTGPANFTVAFPSIGTTRRKRLIFQCPVILKNYSNDSNTNAASPSTAFSTILPKIWQQHPASPSYRRVPTP
ncbi:hypothetical protein ACHAW6_002740 [Cyclotella cf. meneghiniana]